MVHRRGGSDKRARHLAHGLFESLIAFGSSILTGFTSFGLSVASPRSAWISQLNTNKG